jgi:integrase
MRRKRFQKGSVRPRKHGRTKVWVAQWWENGNKRSKVLGPCADITKGQAEAMLSQFLQPANAQAGHHQAPASTFGRYVREVFLPAYRKKWKESTRTTSEADINRYLEPAFRDRLLGAITRDDMQRFLDERATDLSSSVIGHLRWHLNAIFRMAQSDGLVSFNPAEALYTPACRPTGERRVMTKEQVRQALCVLDVRERLILRMAVFDGMRPGEIFAIRIGKIGANAALIDQRIYGGNLDTPKGRKGKDTTRTVALSPGTVSDIALWRRFLPADDPQCFLFPSETGITPLRPNNLWKRVFRPRLGRLGLDWVNFQVLRRTNASLSRKANVDDKVSADQRGHGLGVSLAVYATSDLQQKIEAVGKLESDVLEGTEAAELGGGAAREKKKTE